MTKLIIIGAGGFGRETLDVIEATVPHRSAIPEVAIVDDNPRKVDLERLRARSIHYFGTIHQWIALAGPSDQYVIAIGNPTVRHKVATRLAHVARPAKPLIHPSASIGSMVKLGDGSVVCAGGRISTNVTSGAHTHVNPGATIGHDTTIGNCVSINPGAIVSGNVNIEDRALIGAGAIILQDLTVHHDAIVGAAACVVRDVAPKVTVKGVPAR